MQIVKILSEYRQK